MRIVKRHAGGPENQVINFFRPYYLQISDMMLERKFLNKYSIFQILKIYYQVLHVFLNA